MAEVSANIGWVSDYVFRGIYQEDSSAYAGIDYENENGFYLGTWGADVGQGLETDVYFGYSGGDDFTYSIGYTGYYYTDDFDGSYNEVNLGIGYGIFALDVALGEYDADTLSPGAGTTDYTFTSVTISPEKWPYFKFGSFSQDADGDYFEIGYTWSLEDDGIDLSIAVIDTDDFPGTNSGNTTLTFGITKTIGIGE
jgi:uncharacterized protein (TIGR02001 family)